MAGDWIEVVPPSTSLLPAAAPAAAPVTRSLTPLGVVPFWVVMPPEVVAAGSPRSQRPVVAVSVPLGFRVQPRLVSKLSKNTVTAPGGVTVSDRAALCVVAPLVPTTWKLVEPVAVV